MGSRGQIRRYNFAESASKCEHEGCRCRSGWGLISWQRDGVEARGCCQRTWSNEFTPCLGQRARSVFNVMSAEARVCNQRLHCNLQRFREGYVWI